ncbi:uncharacterized protein LOC120358766 [Solenopsis invicta]|uniref:uncharacterized protein LOC120358766 n=1 Tax=Solenopsis invicta TaxID=13686 RepID=UPI00193C943A|nr:uncharacterized protein LOC120358766 [Solenopsis invicta]
MGVYCLLCGNRNKTVSYHRFPKNKQDREKWLSFCGIKEQDLNTATFLCSNHFKEEDLKKKLNCLDVNGMGLERYNLLDVLRTSLGDLPSGL